MPSPTSRTLKNLRDNGWTVAVVERWNPYARIRVDLFSIIDVLAIKPGCGIMGVQATSGPNVAARVKKALDEPRLSTWLAAGGRFSVWGWAKRGARGKRKVWTQSIRELTVADLKRADGTRQDPKDVDALIAAATANLFQIGGGWDGLSR